MLNKIRIIDVVIVALVIVNIGFYFYERNVSAEIPVIVLGEIHKNEVTASQLSEKKENLRKDISIQFFGDLMLDRNVAKKMSTSGLQYIFRDSVQNGESLFKKADLTIANLEGPFAPKRIYTSKEIAFRFDPALASQLKTFSFSGFSLANNHSYDMGKANVKFTRDTLVGSGLQWFGDEINEGSAYTWYSTSTGKTFAFIGLHNTYHQLNMSKVENAIKDAKQNSNFVIVNVHWGEEYKEQSNKKQQNLARLLIDMGADAIIGHHPHVVQEAEIYNGKPIFYSLGNFVFDQYFSKETQTGLSVVLNFSDQKLTSAELVPFYGVESRDIPMSDLEKEAFLKNFEKNSRLGDKKINNGTIEF